MLTVFKFFCYDWLFCVGTDYIQERERIWLSVSLQVSREQQLQGCLDSSMLNLTWNLYKQTTCIFDKTWPLLPFISSAISRMGTVPRVLWTSIRNTFTSTCNTFVSVCSTFTSVCISFRKMQHSTGKLRLC